jgi:hypothetical protein
LNDVAVENPGDFSPHLTRVEELWGFRQVLAMLGELIGGAAVSWRD